MLWAWLARYWRQSTAPATHRSGAWGEELAARHLRAKGYRTLGRNVRFGPRRELDLVARDPRTDTLVFVEVKTRQSEDFGRPMAAVNRGKRRAFGRAVVRYLRQLRQRPAHVRFDVVEVVGQPGDATPVIRHIANAFSLPPEYRLPE